MAWHKFLAAGLVGSVAVVGCTVTTDNHVGSEGGATGGSTASGGASSGGGGTSSGGKAAGGGGSGGKASGGASGSGGAASCGDAGPDQGCTICLKAKCGAEYTDCEKDDACLAIKNTCTDGEFPNIQRCMFRVLGDAGAGIFSAADLAQCAGDNQVGTTLSDKTDALIRCMHGAEDASVQPCTAECFGDTVPFI